ncbi:MAG: hypothetical protein C0506_16050, partial [Anaerolinea sp.]|nr:hypothetical protein [Anaerolinea sp.]
MTEPLATAPRIRSRETPFVGREQELATLTAWLEAAAHGEGGIALISGEPGIGKSRLLRELADRAREAGWLVLSGRAYDTEGMPPYLPFIEALRPYVEACPPRDLGMQLARGAAEVALLVPEVLERVSGIQPSPPLSRDERFRLFEGVTGFLLNIARAGAPGLVVSLEDLHWADEATLRLLAHLGPRLREAPLLVVATCRTTEADRSQVFTAVVTNLQRERLCERVDVPPFSFRESAQLVEQLTGSSPAEAAVEVVHQETGGNPFFLEEVVRHLQAEGRDPGDEDGVARMAIPESVRQLIGVRLSRLCPESVRMLQVAAVLGDPFSYDALAASVGADVGPLLDALDEASACGFLKDDDGSGSYHFSHALVRETVYAGVSAPRRAMLHAEVAEKLEGLYEATAADHAGELARHFLAGGRRRDLRKAMGHALRAAERAMAQRAFDDAVRYYELALDANGRAGERDETVRCEMLLALATATFKAGDWGRCDEINLAAAEAARAAGLPDLLARACLATAAYSPSPLKPVIPLLEDALAAIPTGDSSCRSSLLSLLACQRSMAGPGEETAPMREASVAMARRVGDVRALAFALRNSYIEWDPTRMEERREAVEEVIQLARELGDKELEVTSQCDHLQTSLLLGNISAVDAGIEAHVRLGDELQQRMQLAHGLILSGMRALLAGNVSHADELNSELQRFAQRHPVPWAAPAVDLQTLILRWEQGRLAELQQGYGVAQEREGSLLNIACRAFICSELGNRPEALALIEQLDANRLATIPDYVNRTLALSLLSQACAAAEATEHAEALYRLALRSSSYVVKDDSAAVCLGSVSRYLGMLATTLGHFDDAERHFDESDSMNSRLHAGPLLAHTKVDRARMHLARHGRGDRRRARVLLEEASERFEGFGMSYHASRARDLLDRPELAAARLRPRY